MTINFIEQKNRLMGVSLLMFDVDGVSDLIASTIKCIDQLYIHHANRDFFALYSTLILIQQSILSAYTSVDNAPSDSRSNLSVAYLRFFLIQFPVMVINLNEKDLRTDL